MFRDRRGVVRLFLLVAVILAGASFGLRSEPAAAAPGPQLITVVCVNQYTGILRYVTEQPCQPHEQTIEIPADLPFTLCVNKYTKVARMSGVSADCQPHENAINIPAPEETLGCANKYTGLIRIVATHAHCQPHELEVFFTALTDAFDDSYDTVGNVMIDVPASDGVLANDKGTNLAIVAVQNPTANGGAVGVGPDGDFVYNPPIGFLGVDTFNYAIDGADGNVDGATVTINVNGPRIWFVDNSAPAGGDGSARNPFDSLAPVNNAAVDADIPGDVIFLFHGDSDVTPYNTQMILESNQQFIGQALDLPTAAGFTAPPFSVLPAVDIAPVLTSPGFGVWLEPATKVAGLNVENTGGIGIVGTNVIGDVTIDTVRVNGTAAGFSCILLIGVDGNVNGSNLSLYNCGGNGMSIANSAGDYEFSGSLLINTVVGDGVSIVNNAATGIVFKEVNVDGANRGLYVQNSVGAPVIINGDSSGLGSGGTIQNIASQPVLLDNASSVSLGHMNVIAGTDPGGNGLTAIVAVNSTGAVVNLSTVSGGNGTTGGGGTAMFCDDSVCNAFSSTVQGGNGGVGVVGMSGGPGIHAINDSNVQLGNSAEVRGGNGADNAVPGMGADGILLQNANILANDSLIGGGNGGVGGAGGAGGQAIDIDIVGGVHDARIYTNTIVGGVHGGGGNMNSLNVETAGGSVCVDATGNTTTGFFSLDNVGGMLGITQANLNDLILENGLASVTTIGPINFNC